MSDDQINANDAPNETLPVESLVSIATGTALADSRLVAERFGKQHQHVLRSIDHLLAKLSQIEDTTVQNWTVVAGATFGFAEKHAPHPSAPSRFDRYYEMDRDAFTLLAMGFTGGDALRWKLKYIRAFNAMETQIRTLRSETLLEDKAEQPSQEFTRYARERLHKIYSAGLFDPEDLLLILFRGNIPYTPNPKYRLYLPESCEAIDISQSDAALARIPRAFFVQVASYPAAAKKFAHSCGVKRSMRRPMASQRPLTVRSAAFRRCALSLEKAFSIGLKSGL